MRNELIEQNKYSDEEFPLEYAEILPKNLALPSKSIQENINLNIERVKSHELLKSQEYEANMQSEANFVKNTHHNNTPKFNKKSGDNFKHSNFSGKNTSSTRAKSLSKPIINFNKDRNGELANKQEFIRNFKISKSPKISDNRKNEIKTSHKIPSKNNLRGSFSKNSKNLRKSDNSSKKGPNNEMLLNTLNYKNYEKWDQTKDPGDSIEEIYEFEPQRTNEDNQSLKRGKGTEQYSIDKKSQIEESAEKFFYDIPIKDNFKNAQENILSPKLSIRNSNNVTDNFLGEKTNPDENDEVSKRKIIEEILKESSTPEKKFDNRPFTPPFTKLVSVNSLKSMEKASSIVDKAKEAQITEIPKNFDTKEEQTKKDCMKESLKLADSIEKSYKLDNKNYLDLIYDQVLGCYYDPKTNIYYELNNNN